MPVSVFLPLFYVPRHLAGGAADAAPAAWLPLAGDVPARALRPSAAGVLAADARPVAHVVPAPSLRPGAAALRARLAPAAPARRVRLAPAAPAAARRAAVAALARGSSVARLPPPDAGPDRGGRRPCVRRRGGLDHHAVPLVHAARCFAGPIDAAARPRQGGFRPDASLAGRSPMLAARWPVHARAVRRPDGPARSASPRHSDDLQPAAAAAAAAAAADCHAGSRARWRQVGPRPAACRNRDEHRPPSLAHWRYWPMREGGPLAHSAPRA